MKQFEAWFEETYPLPRTMERGPIGRDLKAGCKAAYREALEWVLSNKTDIGYAGEAIPADIIRKELKT